MARTAQAFGGAFSRMRDGLGVVVAFLVIFCVSLAHSAGEDDKAGIEIMPQPGHSNVIRAVAFSPDGRLVLSAGYDTIRLWDAASGRLLRLFKGHSSWIESLAFSADGTRILSGSADNSVKLWDAATGRLLQDLRGHENWVKSVAFSPDGRKILSAGADKTARLWDTASGQLLGTFRDEYFNNWSVAFSPDGQTFLLGGDTLTLWDSTTSLLLRRFEATLHFPSWVAFSPDGQHVLAMDRGNSVWQWDTTSSKPLNVAKLAGRSEEIWSTAFSPDRRQVLSGHVDGSINQWDASSGEQTRTFAGHTAAVTSLAFSPDGQQILSGGEDGATILWDVASGKRLRTFGGRSKEIRSIAVSPDGALLLSGSDDKTLKLWDAASGRLVRVFASHEDAILSVAFSPDGAQALSGSKDHTIILWDLASARPLQIFRGHPGRVSSVTFSPDGRYILSGSEEGTIILWDAASGKILRDFGRFSGTVHSVAFSPDGRQAVSGSSGIIHVRLWDIASGTLLQEYGYHLDGVHSVAFSSDGRQILSGGEDGRIYIWDIASNTAVARFAGQKADPAFIYLPGADEAAKKLEGHYGTVFSAVFSPDGRHVLSGGEDGEIILWDIASSKRLRSFEGHSGPVYSVSFSAQGDRMVSSGNDTTIRLWSTASGQQTILLVAADDNKDWLALTPAGFFTAPEQGTDLIAVIDRLTVYSVEQFYQALYRPDLVEEQLKGDPFGRYAKAAEKLNLQKLIDTGPPPRVIIKKAERSGDELHVTATVEDQGGGVGKIEWRIDGRTQGLDNERGAEILTADTDTEHDRSFALKPGRNIISITAYNAQNLVASPPNEITIDAAGISTEKRGMLYVLAIGVDKYADKSLRLGNATADAQALGKALTAVGQNVYDKVKVVAVLDQDVTDGVLDHAFTELAGEIKPEDKFVFFIAGHGLTVDGKYYFLPQNFEPGAGDTYATKGINQDRWQEWFARIKARSSILLYDTCESGSVARNASSEKAAAMDRLTQAVGINVIAASDADQPAREGYKGHGLFTWALLDGLANGDENKDSFIEIFELANHVGAIVPRISKEQFGFEQRPRARTLSNFPLGLQLADVAPGEIIPNEPNRIITRAVSVELTKGSASDRQQKAFTLVRVIKTEGARALIARDGRELGYIPADALAEFQ